MASLLARRRARLDNRPGTRRVDRLEEYDETLHDDEVDNNNNNNNSRNDYYDDDDDEDDNDEERRLSEDHGEAAEGHESSGRGRKRDSSDVAAAAAAAAAADSGGQTDKEIADEYSKPKKKTRPTLTTDHLTGPQGMIVIPTSFAESVQFRIKPGNNKKTKEKDLIDAAARYSTSLIKAYRTFCEDLFPSSAPEDVLSRIERMGTKKEVKTYLTHMREQVRNRHLERVFGKDKAERMVEELEIGLRQQEQQQGDDIHEY